MEPRLITVGIIAEELKEPLHRVVNVLKTRPHLVPAARAGTLRLYRAEIVDAVRRELAAIDARRSRGPARLHALPGGGGAR